jgi:hypothetical protein
VAAAAAHDFNDELTIIFSSVCDTLAALPAEHPSRRMLLEARSAAQRCAWKASGLLNYGARQGVRATRAPLETLI